MDGLPTNPQTVEPINGGGSPSNESVSGASKEQETPKSNTDTKKKVTQKKTLFIIAAVFIATVAIGIASFLYFSPSGQKSNDKNEKSNLLDQDKTDQRANPFNIDYQFAKYNFEKTSFVPSLPNYSISLGEISNLPDFEGSMGTSFSEQQKQALTNNNFFLAQNLDKFYNEDPDSITYRLDDWTALYEDIGGSVFASERKQENSVFITSDFVLHIYHKLLEKEFEYIEMNNFYPSLKEITDKMFAQATQEYSQQSDDTNKQSYERIIAFFAVPKAILDSAYSETQSDTHEDQKLDTDEAILKNLEDMRSTIPDLSYQKAKEELKLILAQEAVTPSPLFGEYLAKENIEEKQDYTQFTPRSHYNKNSILRTYFRAMMWYGRNNFALISPELTRDALNISLLMNETGQSKNWEDIYIPTAFLVGKSDDLGIFEYSSDLKKLGVTQVTEEVVSKVQEDMKDYQGPQIQSSAFEGTGVMDLTKEELLAQTKGFRLMGQRFTPDAYIFSSLTQGDEKPDPETGQSLPSSTTGLMVMSILGNKTADPLVNDWVDENAPESDKVIEKNMNILKDNFSKIDDTTWTQNIYWGWLYTMRSLDTNEIDKTGYPQFMKDSSWNYKNLLTSLGTWTELKHDTLLYAKQSYAEMGGGMPEDIPPVPKGYVEPNIEFFDRLITLVKMTQNGLDNRGLLEGTFKGRGESFLETLTFFKDIAVKELQNEQISDDDFEHLRIAGGNLKHIIAPVPLSDMLYENGVRSALIADVHTDAVKYQILYEADGIPNYIYVAVKDKNGTRLTKGLVFNYYEFTKPLTKRMNDQDWQAINYTQDKSSLPPTPTWSQALYK